MGVKIKVGDNVIVTSGGHSGKTGRVLKVLFADSKPCRVVVSGVNVRKKIKKSTKSYVDVECPISFSNVAILDSATSFPTRVGYKFDESGKKVRFAKISGDLIG